MWKVWRKKNMELDEKNLTATLKHREGSFCVWSCMSAKGVGDFYFIQDTIDQVQYSAILKNNLHKNVADMGLPENSVFKQHNDPKYTSLNTRFWLLYNTPCWMQTPS